MSVVRSCLKRTGCRSSLLLLLSSVALLLGESGDESTHTKVSDELSEDAVVFDLDLLDLDLGFVGDEIHLSLALLFLQLERDASNGSLLDSLHQVGRESSDLVSQSLGLDHRHIVNDALIYMEVVCKPVKMSHKTNQKLDTKRIL